MRLSCVSCASCAGQCGLGEIQTGDTGIVSQILSAYQQKQLIDINAQRLAQGLPPIDSSAMAAQVSVSADPAQMAQVQTMMLYGVGAIMATVLLTRKK